MSSLSATNNSNLSFWKRVEKTESLYRPDELVFVNGQAMGGGTAKELQKEMFAACLRIELYVQEVFNNPPSRVLDLGSGIGANTRPMAKVGSHVTAIDCSKDLLQTFSKQSVSEGCSSKNIRLRRGDITTMESYGENFDLVVAIDILPYISSKTLQSTMKKIHCCLVDKGILIGTIFTTESLEPVMIELSSKLGANFYDGGEEFVNQLMTESGFSLEKMEAREEGGFRFKAIKITPENKEL